MKLLKASAESTSSSLRSMLIGMRPVLTWLTIHSLAQTTSRLLRNRIGLLTIGTPRIFQPEEFYPVELLRTIITHQVCPVRQALPIHNRGISTPSGISASQSATL